MGFAKIIALDLGKFKTVCCVMHVATRAYVFETIEMSPADVHDLIVRHVTDPPPADTLVAFEACDCAGWVHDDVCTALGTSVIVVNANDERWRWRRVKRKTDRDDALKIARLAALEQLSAVHMPGPSARQRRRLMIHRRSVVSRRTQSRNAVRSIFSQQGIALARGGKQWTIAGVAQLRGHARPIASCADVNDLWRGRLQVELDLIAATDAQLKLLDAKLDELSDGDPRVALLRSFKGVGPRLAEAVVLYLDDPKRFASAAAVASYAGLVPPSDRERHDAALRSHHGTRPRPASLAAGRSGVDGLPVSRLGACVRRQGQRRGQGPPKARDRRAGQAGAGHLLGHAQDPHPIPRAADPLDRRARMTG